MEFFGENTMAKFRNQLSQPLISRWRMASSFIFNFFPIKHQRHKFKRVSRLKKTPQKKFGKAFTVGWIN